MPETPQVPTDLDHAGMLQYVVDVLVAFFGEKLEALTIGVDGDIDLTELNARLDGFEGLFEVSDTSISQILIRLSGVESEFATLESAFSLTPEEISAIAARLTVAEDALTSQQGQLTVNADAIALAVTETVFDARLAALYEQNAPLRIATLSGAVADAALTALPVTATTAAVGSNDKLVVQNKDTLALTEVQASAVANLGATSISIASKSLTAPAGSAVFVPVRTLDARLELRANQLQTQITNISTPGVGPLAVGVLESDHAIGSHTAVSLATLNTDLYVGDALAFLDDNGNRVKATVATDTAASASVVAVPTDSYTTVALTTAGAAVVLDPSSQRTLIEQNANAITLRATRSDLSEAAGSQSVGRLDIDYTGASVTTLDIDSLVYPLKDGTVLEVLDADTLDYTPVTLSGAAAQGAGSIPVEAVSLTAAAGSQVILPARSLMAQIQVSADEIRSEVDVQPGNHLLESGSLATTYTQGQTVTALLIDNLAVEIRTGDSLYVVTTRTQTGLPPTAVIEEMTVTATRAPSATTTTVPVQSHVLLGRAEAGTTVRLHPRTYGSRISQTAAEILTTVTAGDDALASSISQTATSIRSEVADGRNVSYLDITASKIKLDSPTFESANFVAGTQGWRLLRDGGAEFNSGVFRNDIKIPVTSGSNTGEIAITKAGGASFPTFGKTDFRSGLTFKSQLGTSGYIRGDGLNGSSVKIVYGAEHHDFEGSIVSLRGRVFAYGKLDVMGASSFFETALFTKNVEMQRSVTVGEDVTVGDDLTVGGLLSAEAFSFKGQVISVDAEGYVRAGFVSKA